MSKEIKANDLVKITNELALRTFGFKLNNFYKVESVRGDLVTMVGGLEIHSNHLEKKPDECVIKANPNKVVRTGAYTYDPHKQATVEREFTFYFK